jgi:hypothetical protein
MLTYHINANQRIFDLESQAFSRSYDLAPRPPFPVSSTDDTQEDRDRETTCSRVKGEGGGREAESYDREITWSSIYHSISMMQTIRGHTIPRSINPDKRLEIAGPETGKIPEPDPTKVP